MQAYSEIDGGFGIAPAFCIGLCHVVAGLKGSPQGTLGGGCFATGIVADRENAQHRIANEPQHFATVILNRQCRYLEIGIQQGQHAVHRKLFRQGCGITQIVEPDNRVDGFPVSPPDVTIQHLPARALADIGFHQNLCSPSR